MRQRHAASLVYRRRPCVLEAIGPDQPGNTGVGSAADQIIDFTPGEDRIYLSAVDADIIASRHQKFAYGCMTPQRSFDGVYERRQTSSPVW